MVIDSPWLRLYIVLEHSRSPSTQDDYSSHRWCQQHTGTVLMEYLLYSVNIDRQAVWCVHYWHCVFIRCIGGYSLYVILQLLGLFIIARGLGWVFWGLGGGVQVGGGGGIFNWNFFFAKKCSWGLKTPKKKKIGGGDLGVFGAAHAPTRGSRGVGKQYTSSYDHDMWPVKILERSGLAVKSYHSETLAAEEEK